MYSHCLPYTEELLDPSDAPLAYLGQAILHDGQTNYPFCLVTVASLDLIQGGQKCARVSYLLKAQIALSEIDKLVPVQHYSCL